MHLLPFLVFVGVGGIAATACSETRNRYLFTHPA